MMAAVYDARDAARGHEAVIVSHQLPIWTTRLHVEQRSLRARPAQAPVHAVLPDLADVRRRPARVGRATPSPPATSSRSRTARRRSRPVAPWTRTSRRHVEATPRLVRAVPAARRPAATTTLGQHRRQGLRLGQRGGHDRASRRPGAARARSPAPRSTARQVSLEDLQGKVVVMPVWASWCGALPRRGDRCSRRRRRTLPATAWSSWASTSATQRGRPRTRSCAAFGMTYPSIVRPQTARRCSASAAPQPRESMPERRLHRPGGPGRGRSSLGEISRTTLDDVVEDDHGRRMVADWFVRAGRHRRRCCWPSRSPSSPGSRRSSPRAWCRCCPATSPTPPGSPARTSRTPGGRPRWSRARPCSCSASPFVFVVQALFFGALGDVAVRYHPDRSASCSAWSRSCSAWSSWGLPFAPARRTGAPGAGGRAGGGAAARAPLRARLDAVHRPDARRGAAARLQRGHRRPRARCSAWPTRWAWASRSSSPGWRSERTLGACAGYAATRSGSPASAAHARRRRPAAGHGRVGGLDRRAAGLDRGLGDEPVIRATATRSRSGEAATPPRDPRVSNPPAPPAPPRPRRRSRRSSCCAGRGASSPRCAPRCCCCSCWPWRRCPGSVVPQENIDAAEVAQWHERAPDLAPIYDRLGLFEVYSSVWFSAIYLLLMVSLVGCIIPRAAVYWRALRARRPALRATSAGSRAYARVEVDDEPGRRARARGRGAAPAPVPRRPRADELGRPSAERGYLREAGNLVFHLSRARGAGRLRVGPAVRLQGRRDPAGRGQGSRNSPGQYDELRRRAACRRRRPRAADVHGRRLRGRVPRPPAPQIGQPDGVRRDLHLPRGTRRRREDHDLAGQPPAHARRRRRLPVGHGYAPSSPCATATATSSSTGRPCSCRRTARSRRSAWSRRRRPSRRSSASRACSCPTYRFTQETGPFSAFPDALDPRVSLLAYCGDLAWTSGEPQTSTCSRQERRPRDEAWRRGRQARRRLPDRPRARREGHPAGRAGVRSSSTGWQRWVKLQVSHSPGKRIALGGVLLAILGLMGSLFIRPRRVWVRARREGAAYRGRGRRPRPHHRR